MRACNSAGCGPLSLPTFFSPEVVAPSGLAEPLIAAIGRFNVSLEWTPPADLGTGDANTSVVYHVFVHLTADGSASDTSSGVLAYNGSLTHCTVAVLPGRMYFFTLVAATAHGATTSNSSQVVTTLSAPPLPAANISVGFDGNFTLVLTWSNEGLNAPQSLTFFQVIVRRVETVQRRATNTTASAPEVLLYNGTDTQLVLAAEDLLAHVLPFAMYEVIVRTVGPEGVAESTPVSFTTPPSAPTGVYAPTSTVLSSTEVCRKSRAERLFPRPLLFSSSDDLCVYPCRFN